jgi:O-antigen/teichoic acid export membrane protein
VGATDGQIDSTDQPTAALTEGEALGRKARRGAFYSLVGYGGGQVLRFVGNLVLTRLLFEEAFGLMSLVGVLLQGLELFSDVGIGPSIVQNERSDAKFVDTAFSIQAIRGVLLSLVAVLVAFPAARFYDAPELVYLVPVAGLTALIAGFNSTKYHTASRDLALGRVMVVDLLSQFVGLVTMVAWALVDRSVWALLSGALATAIARMVATHLVLPGRVNRFAWDRDALGALVRFGRWVFVSTALTFLTGYSVDRLVFGRLVPLDMLGIYHVAAMLAALPTTALGHLAQQVVFPVYARVHLSGGDLQKVFRDARLPIQIAAGWALSGLIAGGPTAMRLIYDERWWGGGWVIQVLAAAAWFLVCESTQGAALLARGEARFVAAGSLAKLVAMVACIVAGYLWFGFEGAVVGFALSEVARYAVSVWAVRRVGLDALGLDLGLTAFVALVGGGVWLAAEALHDVGVPVFAEALLVALVVTLAWWPLARRPLRELRERRRVGRSESPELSA